MDLRGVAGIVAGTALMTACGGAGEDVRDTRPPDATGTVVSVEAAPGGFAVEFAPDPGDEYFHGTVLEFGDGGDLQDQDGQAVVASDVAVGDRLEVWVGSCAESFPVRCPDPVGRLIVAP